MKKTKPLDPEIIAELCGMGTNGDFLKNIGGIFVSIVPLRIHSLRIAVCTKDYGKFCEIAKQMKTCSKRIGALGLSSLCSELEAFASWEKSNAAFDLIDSTEKEFVRVRLALESEMGRPEL